MSAYKRIGVTAKSGLTDKNDSVSKIIAILERERADVFLDAARLNELPCGEGRKQFSCEDDIDLLLVIGGDGTILRTIREIKNFSVPLLSVNRGTVGFLAEIDMKEADELLPALLRGEGMIEKRSLLEVKAMRGAKTLLEGYALNEAVIAQGTIARLVNLETTVNDEPLTTYHADGLILATPTGSTAYSLAAGGPIVHPAHSSMILTPINPHSFSQKPIVIGGESTVRVKVLTKENKFADTEVILTLDGQVYTELKRNDLVSVTISDKTVKFLRRKQDTFFATLREKLRWGERLED